MTRSHRSAVTETEWIRGRFDGHRLRMARELQRLSQGDLGKRVGVSAAAVSQYETGAATPSPETLSSLAAELGWASSGFAHPTSGEDMPAFFRRLRAAPAVERRRSRHFVQLVHELVQALEQEVRLPAVNVPRFPLEAPAEPSAISQAASAIRSHWEMPPGPVDNVVRLIERHGVIVARPSGGHEQIDAFSVPFEDRPIVLMSPVKKKRDRSRFDMAHELAHLTMHQPHDATDTVVEKDADAFAAAFLMPELDIKDELPAKPDWELLLQLKAKWQTSIAALLYRSRTVGPMGEQTYVQAMKTLSARGWRKHEPGDLGEPESPLMLQRAFELSELNEVELSTRTGIPIPLIREVLDSAEDDRPEVVI